MKKLLIILAVIIFFSCEQSKEKPNLYKVEYSGALKNIMQNGDISATVELSKFKDRPNFYALGAVENLEGEIQIINSKPFIVSVKNDTLKTDNTFTKKATLLVYASVKKWKTIIIPKEIISYKQLEGFIEDTAIKNNINANEPFPFLLEGNIKEYNWHVINWKKDDTIHAHKKHITSGKYGSVNNTEVTMLGFYSNAHHAIFTHHTTNMHIHVIAENTNVFGHVDDLMLKNGMILKLPDVK